MASLCFISKVPERVAVKELTDQMQESGLLEERGFRIHHSPKNCRNICMTLASSNTVRNITQDISLSVHIKHYINVSKT